MEAEEARALFDRSAARYDVVNTWLSAGLDRRWRGWAARCAVRARGDKVLDAFAGTGLVGIEAAALGGRVTAADVSEGMLAQARLNARRRGVELDTLVTDLTRPPLPFVADFDAVTLSFGLRYLDEPEVVLADLARLLRPGGRLVVLEFVRPGPGPLATPASVYFFRVLPPVASRVAGRRELYDYLRDSTLAMGSAEDVVRIVAGSGLRVVDGLRAGFGIVAGAVAVRTE